MPTARLPACYALDLLVEDVLRGVQEGAQKICGAPETRVGVFGRKVTEQLLGKLPLGRGEEISNGLHFFNRLVRRWR